MNEETKPVEEPEITETSEITAKSDEQENGDAASVDKTPKRRDSKSERRINKLTARNYELQEGNAKLKVQLDELSQKVDTLSIPKPVRPQRDDFEDLEDYEDAVMDYRIELRKPEAKPETPDKSADPGLVKRFESFITDSEKASPGFEKVVSNAHFPLTDHSLVEIMDMGEDGAEVFTHLNEHPTEAMRISQLSPVEQTKELEKLADSLDETSQAPEPINPLETGDHPTVDESKLSSDQRIRKRQKEMADRQRSIRNR